MRRSEELRRGKAAVEAFYSEFTRLDAVLRTPGVTEDPEPQRRRVAAAAGPATEVLQREQIPASGPSPLPVLQWTEAFRDLMSFTPTTVRGYCEAAMATLELRAEEAERAEHSTAGRLARVLAFPAQVRELAGGRGTTAGKVAFGTAVATQVVGSLLVIAILAVLGWLVARLF